MASYKTLVLIDNSLSFGKGNREIIKETLSCLLKNAGEEQSFQLAVFGETIEYLGDYESTRQEQEDMLKTLTYANRDTFITDTLMSVLDEWQEADYACRSILLISDGKAEESRQYPLEELYFTLDRTEYPIYVIGSVQKDNSEELKGLAALARISGGEMLYTEFEDSEAAVEQKLSEKLLAAMEKWQERYIDEAAGKEDMEAAAQSLPEQPAVEETVSEPARYLSDAEETETVIYEMEKSTGEKYVPFILISALGLGLIFAVILCIWKSKKRQKREEEFMEGLKTEVSRQSNALTGQLEDSYGLTQALFATDEQEEAHGTRLLFQNEAVHDVVLEDKSNPSKFFRRACQDRLIIGRAENACDLVINYDNSVSGRHCELYTRENRWFIRDLQSSNGTRVNGQKVYQELEVHSGDLLGMGQLEFRIGL